MRWSPDASWEAALAKMLAYHYVDTVLDIGANQGQYGSTLRELGYRGRIISFEPLLAAHRKLQSVAANDTLWVVAPRMAIGADEGVVRMHVASNLASSSVLPLLQAHLQAAPDVTYIGEEVAPVFRLDQAAAPYLAAAKHIFLKIDVQGYELPVLQSTGDLLSRISGIQVELSFVPLYGGQALFSELLAWVENRGFHPWGFVPGLTNNATGRSLQTDGIFFRD